MKIKEEQPKLKLQPLRIISGWKVEYNTFVELDPENIPIDDELWLVFTQDLLQIKHNRRGILLDLGWYREADPSGVYGIELIRDFDWNNPLKTFESSKKKEIVEMIELLLWQVAVGFLSNPIDAVMNGVYWIFSCSGKMNCLKLRPNTQ